MNVREALRNSCVDEGKNKNVGENAAHGIFCYVTDEVIDYLPTEQKFGEDIVSLLHAYVQQSATLHFSQSQSPSLTKCKESSQFGTTGAVASFIGTTRNEFKGRRVLRLSYECYNMMAIKVMKQICHEAIMTIKSSTSAGSISRIAVVHRIGDVGIGEASIIIVASSPHRDEAMRCVRYVIDTIKERCPIWKKEVYEDGSMWKENKEWQEMQFKLGSKKRKKDEAILKSAQTDLVGRKEHSVESRTEIKSLRKSLPPVMDVMTTWSGFLVGLVTGGVIVMSLSFIGRGTMTNCGKKSVDYGVP